MDPFPTAHEIEVDIFAAASARDAAVAIRRRLRRRTTRGDPERQREIDSMVDTLRGHGSILRSHLKRSDHHDPPFTPYSPLARRQIKRMLRQLRYERRQLKKMLP